MHMQHSVFRRLDNVANRVLSLIVDIVLLVELLYLPGSKLYELCVGGPQFRFIISCVVSDHGVQVPEQHNDAASHTRRIKSRPIMQITDVLVNRD